MNWKTITIGALVILLFVGLVGALLREHIYELVVPDSGAESQGEPASGDAHARLTATNAAYQRADRLRNSVGNTQEVIDLYYQALEQTDDSEERGQISFKIASASAHSDPRSAASLLKEVVGDENQTDLQRANAAQLLGQLYYRNTDDEAIDSIIFSGEPYESFYTEGDVRLALRQLFEYASSFYPLAISELRVARWYVDEIAALKNSGSLSEVDRERIDSYVATVEERVTVAEFDIARTRTTDNARHLVPEALSRKAEVLGKLSVLEEGSVGDAEVDEAFQAAISEHLLTGNDGPSRVSYAAYLAQKHGAERADDIALVLTPLTSDIDSYPAVVRTVLSTEKDNTLGLKEDFARVAAINVAFENLLRELGWSDADLATQ